MIENWDYLAAWFVYLIAGGGLLLLFWRLTSDMRPLALRDLMRWLLVVLICTPWFADADHKFLAPASAVLLFDLVLNDSESGVGSSVLLLMLCGLVLVVLTLRSLWRLRRRKG